MDPERRCGMAYARHWRPIRVNLGDAACRVSLCSGIRNSVTVCLDPEIAVSLGKVRFGPENWNAAQTLAMSERQARPLIDIPNGIWQEACRREPIVRPLVAGQRLRRGSGATRRLPPITRPDITERQRFFRSKSGRSSGPWRNAKRAALFDRAILRREPRRRAGCISHLCFRRTPGQISPDLVRHAHGRIGGENVLRGVRWSQAPPVREAKGINQGRLSGGCDAVDSQAPAAVDDEEDGEGEALTEASDALIASGLGRRFPLSFSGQAWRGRRGKIDCPAHPMGEVP
jgi:hypothetical protein